MKDYPNIVVIVTDDQGAWAMGCSGNHEIRTPHLDRLARTGTRFENFFCASPVCSPARASLMTGLVPSRHGVLDWLRKGNIDSKSTGVGEGDVPVEYLRGLAGYTDIIARNGYTVGLSGKWHLGNSAVPQKGFSHWFAHTQSGGSYYVNAPMVRNGKIERQTKYLTEAITDDAIGFIRDRNGYGPFCCQVHYTAPHSPWTGCHPEKTVQSYDSCPFETCPDLPAHPWQVNSAPRGIGKKRREILKGYYAAITELDKGVGRILDTLESLGIREDTIVFFCSDNGMCMGHHGIFGKGNGTFPQNMFEESIKVPAIISCPNAVRSGVVDSGLYSHYDWFPTIVDFLEFENPHAENQPGRSFAPLLRGEPVEGRDQVIVYDEYGPVRMVRDTRWKYIHRYPWGPHELYDLESDPGEQINRIDEAGCANRIERFRDKLDHFFTRYADPALDGARMPVTGNGQNARVGLSAFSPRHKYCDENGAKRNADTRWGRFPDPDR